MADLTPINRRVTYRFSPPPVLTPRLAVISGGQRVFAERIKDINSRGARIEFRVDRAPRLLAADAVVAEEGGLFLALPLPFKPR